GGGGAAGAVGSAGARPCAPAPLRPRAPSSRPRPHPRPLWHSCDRDQGPTLTIQAFEGTPFEFSTKSMYGPDGAKVSGLMSWLWLNACVTEESRMSVPFVTDAA